MTGREGRGGERMGRKREIEISDRDGWIEKRVE
jgi:hypothetical protein